VAVVRGAPLVQISAREASRTPDHGIIAPLKPSAHDCSSRNRPTEINSRTNKRAPGETVGKNGLIEPFINENDRFNETGSGQT
jgi:hypothetical protein